MKSFNLAIIVIAILIFTAGVHAQTKMAKPRTQSARVQITANGYEPASLRLRRGIPARITFLRTTDATCAKEVVIVNYGINKNLPLNRPVVVSFTPRKAGEFGFTCGMNMMRGKLIVQ